MIMKLVNVFKFDRKILRESIIILKIYYYIKIVDNYIESISRNLITFPLFYERRNNQKGKVRYKQMFQSNN